MRLKGFLYAQADIARIFFMTRTTERCISISTACYFIQIGTDISTRYLTGLARANEEDPNDIEPITQDSMEVTAFRLGWS